jgi:hypothetical protein
MFISQDERLKPNQELLEQNRRAYAARQQEIKEKESREQEAREQLTAQIERERQEAARSVTTRPEPIEEPAYVRPEQIPCPICGESISKGIALHKLGEEEFVYCILDEKRARSSGLYVGIIKDNLERQAVAAANKET